MKIFLLILFLIPSCATYQRTEGSLARQADLIEDLEAKLPEEDRERFKRFLSNIREEEKLKDISLHETKEEAFKAKEELKFSSEDAGKWKGIRNAVLIILFCIALFIGIKFLNKFKGLGLPI